MCWPPIASNDGSFEVLISPTVAAPMRVAGVLAHELIHVVAGSGHKTAFKRVALAIGLTGKMTATQEGDAFKRALGPILEDLGPYPHAELDTRKRRVQPGEGGKEMWASPKIQGTRLLKVMCLHCGYTARGNEKVVEYRTADLPGTASRRDDAEAMKSLKTRSEVGHAPRLSGAGDVAGAEPRSSLSYWDGSSECGYRLRDGSRSK